MLLIVVLMVTGCTQKEPLESQLIKGKLTEDESTLLTGVGIDHYFVFDYQLVEQDYTGVRVWVEYYKDGQYQGQRFATQTPLKGKKDRAGRLVFSLYKFAAEDLRIVTSLIRDGETSSASATLPTLGTDFGRSWEDITEQAQIQPNQPIPVVGIAESKEFVTGLDFKRLREFTGQPEEFQPENQHLLVFKVMFITDDL